MKILYLLRHAKSSWKDASLQDFDRPLNGRGEKDAPAMGRRLARMKISPELIVSSSALRTRITARLIAEALQFHEKDIQFRDELYHAGTDTLLRHLKQTDDKVEKFMLVGHNPGLTDFANVLCRDKIENIVTTGIFTIGFHTNSWADIKTNGRGKLLFYDFPKNTQNA